MKKPFISLIDVPKEKVKWIDCRFSLQDPTAGRKEYELGHVAGAVYWDLEKDLSDMSSTSGRHPMPTKSNLLELFERSGLHQNDFIVLYDNGGEPFAPRGWFMLMYGNFTNAYILREGWDDLKKSSFLLEVSVSKLTKSRLDIRWNEDILSDKKLVKEIVSQKPSGLLLDARSEERYVGDHEPIDAVAGHIPGALNYNWEHLKDSGKFMEHVPDLDQVVKGNKPITVYCGSGVTAAPLFAMLRQSGYTDVKLYAGSYSDWIRTEQVEIGRPPKK